MALFVNSTEENNIMYFITYISEIIIGPKLNSINNYIFRYILDIKSDKDFEL